MENGESLEKAAVREVQEETGLNLVERNGLITYPDLLNQCTYHTYPHKGKYVMKASFWYNMFTSDDGKLIPQAEEDIEEAIWVDENELNNYYSEMYPSIVDVLEASKIKSNIEE